MNKIDGLNVDMLDVDMLRNLEGPSNGLLMDLASRLEAEIKAVGHLRAEVRRLSASRDQLAREQAWQQAELNAWREIGEEVGRVISLMPIETFEDWFPDWFGPRLFDLQVKATGQPLPSPPKEGQ